MTSDAQAEAGTAEGQGPVEISEDLAERLDSKREQLFEKFEIRDGFPGPVMTEAEKRTENIQQEIQDEVEERKDLREMTTWTTDPVDAQDFD
ncbi:MAG: ribonuclease R, partial [Haladaptatus sp.]